MTEKETKRYEELWHLYKNTDERMLPYQNHEYIGTYTQNLFLTKAKQPFVIRFDVDGIHAVLNHEPVQMIKISDFEELIMQDLEASRDAYQEAQNIVYTFFNVPKPNLHKHKNLIVLNFEELSFNSLLDGKHRYFEHKLQNKQEIPIKTISSFQAHKHIVYIKDFLVYAILHNSVMLTNYANGQEHALDNLICIEEYL